jgi:tRNA1(Val) A37 N6-methylase TrmN6
MIRHATAPRPIKPALEGWIHAARRILRSDGLLTMIWRADGLAEVLAALSRGFGSLAMMPVHGDAERPAIRILVRAAKGGKAPTQIYPSLMLHAERGLPGQQPQTVLALATR